VKIKDGFNRTTRMVYDAGGKLIAEYDAGNGSLKKEYFYRGGELLATIEADGTVKFGTADHLG
jgi:YD repeat-containing protein